MRAVKLYIRNDQIGPVFSQLDIGSGQESFKKYLRVLGIPLILVVSRHKEKIHYVGQFRVTDFYVDDEHPEGWKYRAEGNPDESFEFPTPVPYDDNPRNVRFVQLLDDARVEKILMAAGY